MEANTRKIDNVYDEAEYHKLIIKSNGLIVNPSVTGRNRLMYSHLKIHWILSMAARKGDGTRGMHIWSI